MTQKLLPKADSVYTNASATSFFSETQSNNILPDSTYNLGINGSPKYREMPSFNALKTDKYITKDYSNSWLNFSEDAPMGPGTGHSAFGTPSSCLDLGAGRCSSLPEVSTNSNIYVNNSFLYDAARLYICETTDLEDNFSMPEGDNIRQEARSGVGIQADVVALKGRAGIKLTTGQFGERNSKGGYRRSGSGIELIAGTFTENLQPLVLGNNLEDALTTIMGRINKLCDIVVDLAQANNTALILLQAHSHSVIATPATGIVATPSPELLALSYTVADNTTKGIINGSINKINLELDWINYLTSVGDSYINSDLNRTN